MSLPSEVTALAVARRDTQQQLAGSTMLVGRQKWARLDRTNLRGSWSALVGPAIVATVVAAQMQAASGAQDYVAGSAIAQGGTPDPAGTVSPDAFAGAASDGRDLASLLASPLYQTLALIGSGMSVDDALARGRSILDTILLTQIQDAARTAVGVAQLNDRAVRTWTRQTVPPSCSRCCLLAGRISRVSEAFKRHPRCDCVNVPNIGDLRPPSPRALFDRMTDTQLRQAGWSATDIQAIRDGADIYQITNARRGLETMQFAGRTIQTTTVGATRRGLAGQRLGAAGRQVAVRLTPEQIYADADAFGLSRDQTIDLLRRNGYIL